MILENYNSKKVETIAISTLDTVEFVNVNDIIYLQAESAYTRIVINDAKDIVASKNIKEFEDTLVANNNFIRTHRSYLVNINYIVRYNKTEGGSVEMKGGAQLPVSKKAKDELMERMKG